VPVRTVNSAEWIYCTASGVVMGKEIPGANAATLSAESRWHGLDPQPSV